MDIVARLKRYMEVNGIPVSVLADTAQISRPTLSQILSGRNKKVSNEVISKLHAAFPDLNIMWLLFGDGDMELNVPAKTSEPQKGLFSGVSASDIVDIEADSSDLSSDISLTDFAPSKRDNTSPREMSSTSVDFETKSAGQDSNIRRAVREEATHRVNPETSVSFLPDSTKRVQQIMVFYSDNSFEIFTPAGR